MARAHNNLGVLYGANGQLAPALAEFNAAIQLNAGEYNSYLGRGRIELKQADYDKAVKDFAHAAEIGQSPEAFLLLGNALELKGEKQGALDAYKVTLQLAPGFQEAKARLDALQASAGAAK